MPSFIPVHLYRPFFFFPFAETALKRGGFIFFHLPTKDTNTHYTTILFHFRMHHPGGLGASLSFFLVHGWSLECAGGDVVIVSSFFGDQTPPP